MARSPPGAAREVTGSCHIVRVNGQTVLLDRGMFQGRRSETRDKNARMTRRAAGMARRSSW
jgi:Cft2 family RNA processing exonuclease